jgi:hypothetical protein
MPEKFNNEDKPSSLGTSRLIKAQRWADLSATVLISLHRIAMLVVWIWSLFNDLAI